MQGNDMPKQAAGDLSVYLHEPYDCATRVDCEVSVCAIDSRCDHLSAFQSMIAIPPRGAVDFCLLEEETHTGAFPTDKELRAALAEQASIVTGDILLCSFPIHLDSSAPTFFLVGTINEDDITATLLGLAKKGVFTQQVITPISAYLQLLSMRKLPQKCIVFDFISGTPLLLVINEGKLIQVAALPDNEAKASALERKVTLIFARHDELPVYWLGTMSSDWEKRIYPWLQSAQTGTVSMGLDVLSVLGFELTHNDEPDALPLALVACLSYITPSIPPTEVLASCGKKSQRRLRFYKRYVSLMPLMPILPILLLAFAVGSFFLSDKTPDISKLEQKLGHFFEEKKELVDSDLGALRFTVQGAAQHQSMGILLEALHAINNPGVWFSQLTIKASNINLLLSAMSQQDFDSWLNAAKKISFLSDWKVNEASETERRAVAGPAVTEEESLLDKQIAKLEKDAQKFANHAVSFPSQKERWLKAKDEAIQKIAVLKGESSALTITKASKAVRYVDKKVSYTLTARIDLAKMGSNNAS